jgi:PBP1b-binding outer membrane lipoprotein LpoB
MKKYICILASAALLGACEQRTETVVPAASPAETAAPPATTETTTNINVPPPAETKTETNINVPTPAPTP